MFSLRRMAIACSVALLILGSVASASAGAATFYRLGCSATDYCMLPNDINDKDQVVGDFTYVGDADNGPASTAAFWQTTTANPSGVTTALDVQNVNSAGSDAEAINDSGEIAGTQNAESAGSAPGYPVAYHQPVLWTSPTAAATGFGVLPGIDDPDPPSDYEEGYGTGIDANGDVVGQTNAPSPAYEGGFLAVGSSLSMVGGGNDTDSGDGQSTSADAITADGSEILGEVGDDYSGDTPKWYLWSGTAPSAAGTLLGLTPPTNGEYSFGASNYGPDVQNDLASDGTVLGYTGSDTDRSYELRLPNGTIQPLTGLAGYNAVNAKHQVVGTINMGNGDLHAGLLQPDGTVVDLDTLVTLPADTELFDATTINNNGDIAGVGVDNNGEFGFVLKMGYTVDSTGDQPEASANLGTGACISTAGTCTLRAAIQEVNADASSSPTPIGFDIPSDEVPDGTIPTIELDSSLPELTSPVAIDATADPDAVVAGSQTIGVVVDGADAGDDATGLWLASGSGGSQIEGMQLENFATAALTIYSEDDKSDDDVFVADRVGVDVRAAGAQIGSVDDSPGNVFFEDGSASDLESELSGMQGLNDSSGALQTLSQDAVADGGGIVLEDGSSGATVCGNLIGVHDTPYTDPPESMAADDPSSFDLADDDTLTAYGILVDPSGGDTLTGIRIGSGCGQSNTISGDVIGVAALTPNDSGTIGELEVAGNDFIPITDGDGSDAAPPPFADLIGFASVGDIPDLQLGADGLPNNFDGDEFGAILGLSAGAQVQNDVFGNRNAETLPDVSADGLGDSDGFGLVLADAEGATIGGSDDSTNDEIVGDFVGLTLAGNLLANDTITGSTIGSEDALARPQPSAGFGGFASAYGVLYRGASDGAGSGVPSHGAEPDAGVQFTDDTFQGAGYGLFAEDAAGFAVTGSKFQGDGFGLAAGGTYDSDIGAPGDGDIFAGDGLGVLLGSEQPDSDALSATGVSSALADPSTERAQLQQPNSSLGLNLIDALTSAGLTASSAVPSTFAGENDLVQGNTVGENDQGELGRNGLGIDITGQQDATVGGAAVDDGNTLAGNENGGVWVVGDGPQAPQAEILNNVITANDNPPAGAATLSGLGIDLIDPQANTLFGYGINPQDQTQPDAGPNQDQNAPVITQANAASGQVAIGGTLHGQASAKYLIEIYGDATVDPLGAGEGEQLVTSLTVTTNPSGDATFATTVAQPDATFLSATATSEPGAGVQGVTSEFSIDRAISGLTTVGTTTGSSAGGSSGGGAGTVGTADRPSGGISATRAKVATGGNTVTLPPIITCSSAASGSCTVTASATVVTAATAHSIGRPALGKAKWKMIKVGAGRLELKPGKSGKVSLKLTAKGLKLLKRKRRLSLTVALRITAPGTSMVTRTLHVTLAYRAPKTKRK